MIKSSKMRWDGFVALMAECKGAYRGLVVTPEGRRPFRRARSGWS